MKFCLGAILGSLATIIFKISKVKNENIPFFGLAQAGGQDFQRGYFLGTFRDRNLSSFQFEARLKVWERVGCVIFGGGAQTYGAANNYNLKKYNFAASVSTILFMSC